MIKLFDQNMNEIKTNISSYELNIFPLDNFSLYGLSMDGEQFKTSEHAFQYLKFIDTNMEIAEKIKKACTPDEARLIAHANRKYKPDNWSEVKYRNMEKVLRLKVSQNELVLKKLLDTKDYHIAECCIDEDTDWGIDNNNKGNNNLGKIWMKIRNEYQIKIANKYFVLAEQYFDSSKLLIETIIEKDNCSFGIGSNDQEALKKLEANIKKSDARLLIPALFLGYQCVELYIKGLLIQKKETVENNHETTAFFDRLKECYGSKSSIFLAINKFYSNQIEILKTFKNSNNIHSIKGLYESLRYPQTNDGYIDHSCLKYNGSKIIKQLEGLLQQMNNVNIEVLEEYKKINCE